MSRWWCVSRDTAVQKSRNVNKNKEFCITVEIQYVNILFLCINAHSHVYTQWECEQQHAEAVQVHAEAGQVHAEAETGQVHAEAEAGQVQGRLSVDLSHSVERVSEEQHGSGENGTA